ncbi:MAG TPA: DNA polymerase [Gemmataceae bacterium]|nr:DNA polymerase [Gemmataceae bacterium]
MSVKYLFIDMNSYFASVEQQLRPNLRGVPVAVAAVDAETTSCIAASYEAKRFGVRTGTRVSEARRLCPGIQIVSARPRLYVEKHNEIIAAVESVLPVAHVLSIDEMVCRLLGDHLRLECAVKVGGRIKHAICERAGEWLRCSIGLAPNRLLAKVAADMQKPDGLTVLRREDLPNKLMELKLTDFPGIGPKMEKRLNAAGVTTTRQLLGMSPGQLAEIWGSNLVGGMWYHRLRGEDVPDTPTQRRSIGHSRVLEPTARNEADARAILVRLIHKAAARLRHVGQFAGSVHLSVSYLGREKWKAMHRIDPCQDTLTLIRAIMPLWARRAAGAPLKIGIVLADLVGEQNVPRPLFEVDHRLLELAKAMDAANRRCGRHAVYFGGMHGKGDSLSTRIAFGTVPDLDLTDC